MPEDIAVRRIRAARTAVEFPEIFPAVADGRLSVTAVWMLAKHLTREDAAGLLAAAANRSIKQLDRLLAERFGRKRIPVAAAAPAPGAAVGELAAGAQNTASATLPASMRVDSSGVPVPAAELEAPAAPEPACEDELPELWARISPVAPGRWQLVAVIDEQMRDQIVATKELLGHAVPAGALVEVLRRGVALHHAHVSKHRCGATDRPRRSSTGAPRQPANPRHIPNAVRRAVWERDGGRCAYVSPDGHRCAERSRDEVDHIVPVARGGAATVGNLRLLCRAHNQYVAEQQFGREHIVGKRDSARRQRAEERLCKQAERERTEARKAAIQKQREEPGEAFRNLGYRGADLERALAHCASRAEAPMAERLRHALSCSAPNARRECSFAAAATGHPRAAGDADRRPWMPTRKVGRRARLTASGRRRP